MPRPPAAQTWHRVHQRAVVRRPDLMLYARLPHVSAGASDDRRLPRQRGGSCGLAVVRECGSTALAQARTTRSWRSSPEAR
jgi:hypothetical protein